MDRSVHSTLSSLFTNRPRSLAISRQELRERLLDLCGVDVHVRDLQRLIDDLAGQQGWCIISESRGYWRLDEHASAEDLAAAMHSVNTLRAHGQAELEKASLREKWIGTIKSVQEHAERRNRQPTTQVGLFT